MKIGELAQATQTPAATIRFYEREGLMPTAARSAANYRRYGPAHVQRLALIRRCRGLDMSLDEVRALLALWDEPAAPCDDVNRLLDAHLAHVQARLRELRALQRELQALRQRCQQAQTAGACGILRGLAGDAPADAPGLPGQPLAHRHRVGSHRGG
jgi:Cd(II)/Pb(II)-responsive transcriptional regulator